MRIIPLLLAFHVALNTAAAGELKEEFVFGNPVADREKAWPGHVTYASWLDEARIVFWSAQQGLVCLSLETKMPVWTRKTGAEVDNWSVSQKSQLIAFEWSEKQFGDSSVAVVDGKTGKAVFEASSNQLAKLLKVPYVIVSTVALSPEGDRLHILSYSKKFERSGYAFDPRNPAKVLAFQVDPSVRELSFSADGKRIAYVAAGSDGGVADQQVLAVRSIDDDRDVFLKGKRVLVEPEVHSGTVDAAFYSHVRYDGQNLLLLSRDNSWSKGDLFLRDLRTGKEKSFDGRNGHIELDARFDLKRIALTGTSTDVVVLDLEGKVIAEKKKATRDRNVWVEFSPKGDRLLVGSWDNTVRVFRIVE